MINLVMNLVKNMKIFKNSLVDVRSFRHQEVLSNLWKTRIDLRAKH